MYVERVDASIACRVLSTPELGRIVGKQADGDPVVPLVAVEDLGTLHLKRVTAARRPSLDNT